MISERELTRKISIRLIPFMFLLYIVAYLDRVNLSFASLQMNALCMVITSKHSDATRERRVHVAVSAIAGAVGLIGAGIAENPALELAALSLAAAGIWGTLGP